VWASDIDGPEIGLRVMLLARIRFASWMFFEIYALRIYPGKTAKEIVEMTMLATTGISRSELIYATALAPEITAPASIAMRSEELSYWRIAIIS
jgi:hypothetical protein